MSAPMRLSLEVVASRPITPVSVDVADRMPRVWDVTRPVTSRPGRLSLPPILMGPETAGLVLTELGGTQ